MYKFIEILKEFISFKSISTDSNFKHEVNKCAKWLQKLFIDSGYKSTLISGYGNNDIVYSEIPASEPIEETMLIYGHYDVQPADINAGWSRDLFDLYEENKKLIGRGVVDNKGQILIHIYQILQLAKERQLKQNIKFLIEVNEETDSPNLEQFIEDHKSLLKCDYVLFSDGELT